MRIIDADKLPKYTGYALSASEVATAVENAPAIDAVEVVRCKDCKWFEPEIEFGAILIGNCPYLRLLYNQVHGEAYCFRGVRRESEEEDNGKV